MLTSSLTPKSIWSYNPSPTGCVLYLPLWHPNLSGPVFKDIGPSGSICTAVGVPVWSPIGRTMDGDDAIALTFNSIIDLGDLTTYTIMAWLRTTDRTTAQAVVGLGSTIPRFARFSAIVLMI